MNQRASENLETHPIEYLNFPNCFRCSFPASCTVSAAGVEISLCRKCVIAAMAEAVVAAHIGATGRPAAGMAKRVADLVHDAILSEAGRLLRERGRLSDVSRDELAAVKKSIMRHHTRKAPVPRAFAEISRAMKREAAVIPVARNLDDDDQWPRSRRGRGRPIGSGLAPD